MRVVRQIYARPRQHAQARGEHTLPQQILVQLQVLRPDLRDQEQSQPTHLQDASS